MRLDLATVLVQWATGGLLVLWVTTRRREVSLGYGWVSRLVFAVLAAGGVAAATRSGHGGVASTVFMAGSVLSIVAALGANALSVARRRAGVQGRVAQKAAARERVAAMAAGALAGRGRARSADDGGLHREFSPRLDLLAPACGAVALFGAASYSGGGGFALAAARLLVGAAFLGCITDAMLLGHWYLVQPGLRRAPLIELVRLIMWVWPFEVVVLCLPRGMVQVIGGSINDGYGGLLGTVWIVAALTTLGLVVATWFALRERYYSAVMAATGLLYLAILTGFGTDLVARAVLAR